ncbi:hypothetical protein OROGR_010375 [Orobanche gracilis]
MIIITIATDINFYFEKDYVSLIEFHTMAGGSCLATRIIIEIVLRHATVSGVIRSKLVSSDWEKYTTEHKAYRENNYDYWIENLSAIRTLVTRLLPLLKDEYETLNDLVRERPDMTHKILDLCRILTNGGAPDWVFMYQKEDLVQLKSGEYRIVASQGIGI